MIERLSDAKQQIDFGHSSYSQWVANDFLESPSFAVHLDNLVKQLESRRNQIIESLNTYLKGEMEFLTPNGGIHLWCKIKNAVNENRLLEESLKNGVIYAPGSTMGSNANYVRFTYAKETESNIDEGIRRFAAALKSSKE